MYRMVVVAWIGNDGRVRVAWPGPSALWRGRGARQPRGRARSQPQLVLVLVLVLHRGAVTVSSTGAENQFQVDDNCHVGRPCGEVSLAPPYPELFASYGASAVTRTSGRGHVAEAKTNVIEVIGFSIRVSKETLLPLNVHFCVQLPAQRC